MDDLKGALEAHDDGELLTKPDEQALKDRRIANKNRKDELEKVNKSLKKSNQVKFLVDHEELTIIKNYAKISRQTQSEFIRSALWEKIRSLKEKQKPNERTKEDAKEEKEEEKLRLEELQKIRRILKKRE
ncbi:hypothetical protein LCGC14_1244220 [marine sediment metagenome]|uniref:Uncharacterized protein n=1 Tax=marine sediment metagenome TaxID=412755 RepID=A0A0F9P910_9ZZZZ